MVPMETLLYFVAIRQHLEKMEIKKKSRMFKIKSVLLIKIRHNFLDSFKMQSFRKQQIGFLTL